ncbi:hypothetical protein HK105_207854 [Polyrhizophydium stewartii]|uniref:Velvet domain-containing protein n=1 Tax=Polyrhizophydium stewartii TaxID=2732419 RepID=A0ABR4MZB0_9FUNG
MASGAVSSRRARRPKLRLDEADPGTDAATPVHLALPPLESLARTTTQVPAYRLVWKQQPDRARMSGFAMRDRRPLDPTPILQVVPATDSKPPSFGDAPYLIAHISLWNADMTHEFTCSHAQADASDDRSEAAPDVSLSSQQKQVLLGNMMSTCHVLKDLGGTRGMFFVFPDLAVRLSGTFRLRATMYDLRGSLVGMGPVAHADTGLVTVYSPRAFPGLSELSELGKSFTAQGVRIHTRSDFRPAPQDATDSS